MKEHWQAAEEKIPAIQRIMMTFFKASISFESCHWIRAIELSSLLSADFNLLIWPVIQKTMVTRSFNYFYQVSGVYAVLLDNNNLLSEVVVLRQGFSNYCSLLLSQLASTQIYLVDVWKITVLLLHVWRIQQLPLYSKHTFFVLFLFCFILSSLVFFGISTWNWITVS